MGTSISTRTGVLAAWPMLVLGACTADLGEPGNTADDDESLEQRLGLTPRLLSAAELRASGGLLNGAEPRYFILSREAGELDLAAIAIEDQPGSARGMTELFELSASAHTAVQERNALLLVAAPAQHAETLCARFQFGHDEADFVKTDGQQYFYSTPAGDGRVHALCLLPPSAIPGSGKDKGTGSVAPSGTMNYGGGSYTVRLKTLKCNDPRDWENWPYNGDEARMRGFYDGYGGAQLWGSDNVKSGNVYSPNRYVHYNNVALIELFDYDSSPWNASDKLGALNVYRDAACMGDRIGHFDGSGGGHNWDYDLTYRVYGPNCPCQSQEPAVYKSYTSKVWTTLSTTITSYSYYCSGGIYYRQAWGNRTRREDTYSNTYNESCEMQTLVSSQLVSTCEHYETGVAIGSPQQWGTCGYCGDGYCSSDEVGWCSADCGGGGGCYPQLSGDGSTMYQCPVEY
jgi:hypothetical protein